MISNCIRVMVLIKDSCFRNECLQVLLTTAATLNVPPPHVCLTSRRFESNMLPIDLHQ